MSLWELFVIAVGLSMDAFAVSICKGLSVGKCKVKHMLICGLYFGAFQAIMPSIGYLLGAQFETLVTSVAPYIAFALLTLIGFNMIRESCSKEEEEEATCRRRFLRLSSGEYRTRCAVYWSDDICLQRGRRESRQHLRR